MIGRLIAYGFGFAPTAPDEPRLIPTFGFTPFIPVTVDIVAVPGPKRIGWSPDGKSITWQPKAKSLTWSPAAKN